MDAPDIEIMPFHSGADYFECLTKIHAALEPSRYLEIGVWKGESLARAKCAAIAVDTHFLLAEDIIAAKPECHLFQSTSDDFFTARDPVAILGGPVDLAFLDGMHRFEFLLRDFANAERVCHRDSVIVLHDCLPIDPRVTNRSDDPKLREAAIVPGWWCGDVWKLPILLRTHRPDLTIIALDALPTGLMLISRLDPGSSILNDRYTAMVDQMMQVNLADYGVRRLFDQLSPLSTSLLDDPAALRGALGL